MKNKGQKFRILLENNSVISEIGFQYNNLQKRNDFFKNYRSKLQKELKNKYQAKLQLAVSKTNSSHNPEIYASVSYKFENGGITLNVRGAVHTLEAFAGIPIHKLYLNSNTLKNFSPIATKYLQHLHFHKIELASLEPFRKCPIQSISSKSSIIKNFSAMHNWPLRHVDINIKEDNKISFLKSKNLNHLGLYGGVVDDVSFIESMKLKYFGLENCKTTAGLNLLKNLPLKSLYLRNFKAENLNIIKELKLHTLSLIASTINDYSIISEQIDLKSLDLSYSNFAQLSLLSGMKVLNRLNISRTNITSLEDLSNLNLTYLNLYELSLTGHNKLAELSALKELICDLEFNQYHIPIIENLPIKDLNISKCKILELGTLNKLRRLERLTISTKSRPYAISLKGHPSLRQIRDQSSGYRSLRDYLELEP